MIAIQALTILMITVFFLSDRYSSAWQQYAFDSNSSRFYANNLSPRQQSSIRNYILAHTAEDRLFLIKQQNRVSDEGLVAEKSIGVYGDPQNKSLSMNYLGTPIVNVRSIQKLLRSSNAKATLGLGRGSVNSVGKIPEFNTAYPIVVSKLENMIDQRDGVNGVYQVLGRYSDRHKFIAGISRASGLSVKQLTTATAGSYEYDSLFIIVALVILALTVFLLFVSLSALTVKSINKYGKVTLLGWPRLDFFRALLAPFLQSAIFMIPAGIVIGYFVSGWPLLSFQLIGYLAAAGLLNVLLLAVTALCAGSILFAMKPLDAIRERIPKKLLYLLAGSCYLCLSILLVYGGWSLDGPLNELSANARLSLNWQRVSKMQVLNHVSVGQDSDSFTMQSNHLDQSFYDWYRAIADQPGVYIINSAYYSRKTIDDLNANAPKLAISREPFWQMSFSPNYLVHEGISLSHEQLSMAKAGYRLYLFPDNLSSKDIQAKEKWIKANDTQGIQSGDVQTVFNRKRQFLFASYHPKKSLFTWNSDDHLAGGLTAKSPIIYVATAENMTYQESGSLRANGLSGILKFSDRKTAQRYANAAYFGRFNLIDNQPRFIAIQAYIDGFQKTLRQTITWFGSVSIVLMLVLVLNLIALAVVFRIANEEKLSVKKFLGYSYMQLYRGPIVFISLIFVCQLIASILVRSRLALVEVLLIFALQLIIFRRYMSKNEFKQILALFKGE